MAGRKLFTTPHACDPRSVFLNIVTIAWWPIQHSVLLGAQIELDASSPKASEHASLGDRRPLMFKLAKAGAARKPEHGKAVSNAQKIRLLSNIPNYA